MAVDPIGRLLFWTDTIQDVINVTRLDNSSNVGVVVKKEGEMPRLLMIHPMRRLIFWTNVGANPQLVRARFDGSHRIVIKNVGQNITAIALDLDKDMVVWAEGSQVFMCNIDGENQYPFLSDNKGVITQLAIHADSLYWLERGYQQLRKFHFKSTNHESVKLSNSNQITDLVAIQYPMQAHSCAFAHHCSHICIGNETHVLCACPQGLALQDDRRTCSAVPDCGRDFFTCGRDHTTTGSNSDCIPAGWRCDGQMDCQDGTDEIGCPACKPDQFRCQTGQCIEQSWVCDGNIQCPDGFDEERCCKTKEEFKCPETDVCIPISEVCDGHEHCANGTDESDAICEQANRDIHVSQVKNGNGHTVIIVVTIASTLVLLPVLLYYFHRRFSDSNEIPLNDQASDPLSPKPTRTQIKSVNGKMRNKPVPDVVHMSMLSGSQSLSYDRCHITGASSSTNGSSLAGYPRETLNPPPSPATTAASTRGSSPTSRFRPYRHYRSINQPPPPTPCSTDVCDESDYNYPPSRSKYDAGPFPPPPTPRSHCHSESCPPSPSSRSSTYFSPLPPPPSPVPSPPRGYDS